ncbi:hypothetical protein, variant [Blastomyces dermatitidis ATCC 18188]|uniref:Uncharacterized protein n=1 Tax=Ajellomyces dermatitidis (strain ATCC 18188 / CBS 674.68) TaxID=653446 RepID=F2TCK6_AJEDA|nr:hypothetical protein BDDG_03910 [Blastomyces dermatitidis ATCC 18188]KMW67417.1 hypothetical protein, variant [Blastomyces dermatitidis ATCC 18188]
MQVPPEYPASNDSSIRASLAQQQPSGWMLQELQSLRYFNKNECTVVPKLLDVVRSWQGESDMPVPQGYLVFIVMEKVPAVCITGQILGVQSCPAQQDQGLRASFRRSLTAPLLELGARPSDCQLDNLVYDERTDTLRATLLISRISRWRRRNRQCSFHPIISSSGVWPEMRTVRMFISGLVLILAKIFPQMVC